MCSEREDSWVRGPVLENMFEWIKEKWKISVAWRQHFLPCAKIIECSNIWAGREYTKHSRWARKMELLDKLPMKNCRRKKNHWIYTWLHCYNCVIKLNLTAGPRRERESPFTLCRSRTVNTNSIQSLSVHAGEVFWKINLHPSPLMNSSEKFVLTLSPHRNAIKQRVTMLNGKKLLFICSFATLCVQSFSLPACSSRTLSQTL